MNSLTSKNKIKKTAIFIALLGIVFLFDICTIIFSNISVYGICNTVQINKARICNIFPDIFVDSLP